MTRELPTACIVGGGHVSATVARCLCDYGFSFECYADGWKPVGGSGGAGGTGGLASEDLDHPTERRAGRHDGISDSRVIHARRMDNGAWGVQLESGETRFFDALVVTARPRLFPRTPVISGAGGFLGASLHASAYPGEVPFRGTDVLVIGTGHSAETVAAKLAGSAGRVLLAPPPPQQQENTVRLSRPGRFARYLSFCSRPGQSARRFAAVVGCGVRMASEPVRVAGRTIYFADGYSTEIDVIVYATGFSPVFGFLEQSLETAGGHEFELYKRVFRPVIDSLFFVGSFLPALSGTRAAAMQVVLVAEYLSGAYALPELFTMRNQPHYDRGRTATRLFDSDPTRGGPALARYIADLEGELRRGRRRALRDGVRPPLPVVASSLRPQAEPWQAVTDSATRTRQSGQEPHKHEQAAARTAAA